MFNFFANLYLSIMFGSWSSYPNNVLLTNAKNAFDNLPIWNVFNNSTNVVSNLSTENFLFLIAYILSIICCIGFFWVIVKSVKKLFTCFLDR